VSRTGYLAAAVFYVCMLLVTAPASLLAPLIQRISHERLSLANCQGTIWHGSATPLLLTDKSSGLALHTLHWRINPQALLLGQLKAEIGWDDLQSATPMWLTLDGKSVNLTHVLLPLPAEVLSELSPYLKPAQLSGSLTIESPQLTYTDNHLQGNARARWSQAGSAMSAVHPLGDYQIDIVAAQDSLRAVLTTMSGVLLLDGQGSWSPAQKFHFNGTARATDQAALNELLHHLGPETTPGVYRISL
jgi:general secretion pathway protein N